MGKKILLVSNEMSYTGAPFALLNIAKILVKNEFNIEIATLKIGSFNTEFENIGLQVHFINENNLKEYKNYFKQFDLIISNTIVCHKVFNYTRKFVPSIFYIMEAEQWTPYCYNQNLKPLLKTSDNIYCVSEYSAEWLKRNFGTNANILHNCTEDLYNDINKPYYKDNKINITVMGTISRMKGFHTIIEAVKSLPENYQNRLSIRFVGKIKDENKEYCEKILSDTKQIPCIEYIGEITNLKDKIQLYKDTDIVIVPSIDESCSLVALEGAMMGCALILTKNVGAKYIVNQNNGFLFDRENSMQLAELIKNFIDKNLNIKEMGKHAREEYLKTSTTEIYEKNILKMVNDSSVCKSSISNIILYWFEVLKNNIFSITKLSNRLTITIFYIKIKLNLKGNL